MVIIYIAKPLICHSLYCHHCLLWMGNLSQISVLRMANFWQFFFAVSKVLQVLIATGAIFQAITPLSWLDIKYIMSSTKELVWIYNMSAAYYSFIKVFHLRVLNKYILTYFYFVFNFNFNHLNYFNYSKNWSPWNLSKPVLFKWKSK